MIDGERQPHAVLDLASREFKGMKIARLLNLQSRPRPLRLLEVGTGSGGIAHFLATHPELRCQVDAVDVHDNRLVSEGYKFQKVSGTRLPFADETFDVVLTNHVIEHVGDSIAQHMHLAELHRVLQADGIGYLAVPNRWMLVEPHYRLAFLSWLPHPWRTPYLRAMRRGEFYDCEPLQLGQLEEMFRETGFRCRNLCVEAWRMTLEIERPHSLGARVLRLLPDPLLTPLRRIIPTLIYTFEKAPAK